MAWTWNNISQFLYHELFQNSLSSLTAHKAADKSPYMWFPNWVLQNAGILLGIQKVSQTSLQSSV